MDEFQEFDDNSKIDHSNHQQSNANLSKLGGGSRFTTLNAKSNKPLIPKPPSNIDADKQKAAI
jgi:hypothetical protein